MNFHYDYVTHLVQKIEPFSTVRMRTTGINPRPKRQTGVIHIEIKDRFPLGALRRSPGCKLAQTMLLEYYDQHFARGEFLTPPLQILLRDIDAYARMTWLQDTYYKKPPQGGHQFAIYRPWVDLGHGLCFMKSLMSGTTNQCVTLQVLSLNW